jgi:hypothetical protein
VFGNDRMNRACKEKGWDGIEREGAGDRHPRKKVDNVSIQLG